MKKTFSVGLVGVGLIFGSAVAQDPKGELKAAAPLDPKDVKARFAYAIGLNLGKSLKDQAIDLDAATISKGIADGLSGAKPVYTKEQCDEAYAAFEKEFRTKKQAEAKVAVDKNSKEGAAFLAANKAKPGVKTTKSGLQYKVLKEGTGATPKASDTVKANYRGTFLDGTEFDSSYKGGKPISFPVEGVIAGWTEALQLMKVGSKWQLFIPGNLAYGEEGNRGIPPNSTLIFEVELVGIE